MKKLILLVSAFCLLSLPLSSFAMEGPMEGPMALPMDASADAAKHNIEGINEWDKGSIDSALQHFQEAAKVASSVGETHFNMALCLDKLGQHGEATRHFEEAKKNANGNKAITESPILNAHLKK